jgi:hypothetical protein
MPWHFLPSKEAKIAGRGKGLPREICEAGCMPDLEMERERMRLSGEFSLFNERIEMEWMAMLSSFQNELSSLVIL